MDGIPKTRAQLEALLAAVGAGQVAPGVAAEHLAHLLPGVGHVSSGADTPIARIDHDRRIRCGFPEVVLGASKEIDDLVAIAVEALDRHDRLLVTRASEAQAVAVAARFPQAEWHARARAITVRPSADERAAPLQEGVLIVTAGTGDVPVAEEARVTAEMMGQAVACVYDAGVAGLHRILAEVGTLRKARVVVVCAGMDGALPSVVGGLVGVPVIAVPTSVGYGMQLEGLAPLLTMMNACAPNVSVVNIDNGFGAGYLAALINSGDQAPADNEA